MKLRRVWPLCLAGCLFCFAAGCSGESNEPTPEGDAKMKEMEGSQEYQQYREAGRYGPGGEGGGGQAPGGPGGGHGR